MHLLVEAFVFHGYGELLRFKRIEADTAERPLRFTRSPVEVLVCLMMASLNTFRKKCPFLRCSIPGLLKLMQRWWIFC